MKRKKHAFCIPEFFIFENLAVNEITWKYCRTE